MTKQVKVGLALVALVAVLTVGVFTVNPSLGKGMLVRNTASGLIKGHYFEYFKGQDSNPFYSVETIQQSTGGKIEVLDKNGNLVKTVCNLSPGLGGGCSWDGTNNNGETLPMSTEKFKFKVTVAGPNGVKATVESPLFLFDTTGI